MQAAILGKKMGMTRVFRKDGGSVPVTVLAAGPCPILQVKTAESDGYEAVQLGYDALKPARSKMPVIGHARKAGASPQRFVREIRLNKPTDKQPGENVTVGQFEGVKWVDVVGTTIGKGFQGVMKRHLFKGQPGSHGTERKHRSPGGIGASGDRGRGRCIKKGKRMPGHMGHVRCTTRNHEVISVDAERGLLLVRGSIPGPKGSYVVVTQAKTKS